MGNLLHSAYFLLVVLALIFTLINGLSKEPKIPLWIAVMILCIACMVIGIPST